MKILVTGGAGFIGSHTCDRLLALGHDVVVLDALTAPVHRDGRPEYLSPEIEFYQGDVRNRDLLANLLRRVDAVYHFAAYQDYLPDFARFTDVNVVSTALIYEIIVAERLDIARVVVASSQSAMGEGLYRCPIRRRAAPRHAPGDGRWRPASGTIPCPLCGGPLEMQATPERISNPQNAYGMSKLGEEMVAVNLGRRYGIPTVALRYSIVQGPRQSVYNAYSGACRIFCLSYLQGIAPVLYEDGGAIRDYVNIDDVVDANVLVLDDDRAAGRVFNVGGGKPVTTREFADIVMRQYGSTEPGLVTGEYRFGDTRHILSDISALRELGWEPRRGRRRLGRGVRRVARGHATDSTGCWPRPTPRCAASGSCGRRPCEGLPARRRRRQPAAADHRHDAQVHGRRSAAGRCSTSGSTRSTRAGVDEVLVNLHHLPDVVAPRGARTGPPVGPDILRAAAARQRRHAARQPRLGSRRGLLPGLQRRQPDRLRPAVAGRGPPGRRRGRDLDRVPLAPPRRRRGRGSRSRPARVTGFTEKPEHPSPTW